VAKTGDEVVRCILDKVERLPQDYHEHYFRLTEMLLKDDEHVDHLIDQLRAEVFGRLIQDETVTSDDLGLFKELFAGLDLSRRSAMVYNLVFLVRRMVFICTVVFGHEYPGLSIFVLLLSSLINLIYLALARPFEDD